MLGGALVVLGIRLTIFFLRANARHQPSFVVDPSSPGSPEERTEREARKGEQVVVVATMLDASVREVAARMDIAQARGDASRSLRNLAHDAAAAGAQPVAYQALELDPALALPTARSTCSLGALKGLDAAVAAASPDLREKMSELLAISRRHVERSCELLTE